jgi:enoyl-CoA hydratase/carnithine racemase
VTATASDVGVGLQDVTVEDRDGVRWVTIDRPDRLNAIREQTYEELAHVVADTAGRPDIGVLVLTGRGERAFSAGGDMEMAARLGTLDAARYHNFRRMIGLSTLLMELDKPVVAAVNGLAVGGGTELLFFCDLVWARESAWFRLNGTALGGCSWWGAPQILPAQVGLRRAEAILYLGDRMSAAEAKAAGLINEVVPDTNLAAAVDDVCQRLLSLSAEGLRLTKSALRSVKEEALTSMSAAAEANAGAIAGPGLQAAFAAMRAGEALDWRARRPRPATP